MHITFFNITDIVHFKFISQGQTVKQILKPLREGAPDVCPIDWILHHDNASAHKALSVKQSSGLWPKNRLLKLNTHPVPLIWLLMTSGYFQK